MSAPKVRTIGDLQAALEQLLKDNPALSPDAPIIMETDGDLAGHVALTTDGYTAAVLYPTT